VLSRIQPTNTLAESGDDSNDDDVHESSDSFRADASDFDFDASAAAAAAAVAGTAPIANAAAGTGASAADVPWEEYARLRALYQHANEQIAVHFGFVCVV
jgi:hypothetical protein